MSGFSHDDFPSSPRRRLAGATRPSANPRIHAIQKPYSRPNSYAGPSSSSTGHELALTLNGNGSPLVGDRNNGSPTKPSAPTTRPTLPTSQSQRSFPRSGSESSLFGSLKGLISKPLSWLATPRSTTKRDQSTWNAGLDSEDPESPSVKKLRRISPPRHGREKGVYEPQEKGKGKEREMLPPLPTLSGGLKKLPTSRAGSSLPHSQSMPYLDPPSNVLSPPKKRGGVMTRSKGMNLAAMAGEDEQRSEVEQKKEVWSPWKQQAQQQQQQQDGRSRTPVRRSSRPSISEARDVSQNIRVGPE
jgi:nucleoporin NUP1